MSGRPVPDPHAPDDIPLLNPIHDVQARDDAAEYRVAPIEVRLRRVGDEELAAAGVGPVERHPDSATKVRQLVDLVANREARPSLAVSSRVASLNHEVGDDAMNRQPVEEALTREAYESVGRDRGIENSELEPL